MNLPQLPRWHEILIFYDNLTLHIVPGPRSLSYIAPFALLICALLTPPRLLPRHLLVWLVLPLIIAIQLHVWVTHKSFDVISSNGLLTAFMFLGWYDVRKDFKYVHRLRSSVPASAISSPTRVTGETKTKSSVPVTIRGTETLYWLEPYPLTLLSRIRWVGVLMSSMRLTDWHIGVPSHDSRQPAPIQPFWKFVRETVAHLGFAYILLDLTSPYMLALAPASGGMPTFDQSVTNRITRSFLLLAHFYAALALLLALLPHLVSIGAMFVVPSIRSNSLVSPLTWPSHLGPLSSVYSGTAYSKNIGLRAFWGSFWHQNMRYVTSTPGIAMASALNLKSGSKLRYIMMVISSFLFSGIIHMGVVPPEPLGTMLSCWEMRLMVASFFWLQIVGILIEDTVQSLFDIPRKTPITGETGQHNVDREVPPIGGSGKPEIASINVFFKCLIMMWTTCFLALTAWWTVLPVACEMGWLRMSFIPVSLSRYLLF